MAYSGLILAINTIIFLLINIIETNTLALMALASFLPAIILIEFAKKNAFAYTCASIILGFIVLSNKMYFIVYALSFGIYGLLKSLIEKNKNIKVQYILKLSYANIVFFVLYYISIKLFVKIDFQIWYLLAFNIAFLLYDLVYTQFITFYLDKIRKRLNINKD